MQPDLYRYPRAGLGLLLVIPCLALLLALTLAYLVFVKPAFLDPSTLPAGYFGFVLAMATSAYYFRLDWHRRQAFEPGDAGLTVIGPRARRRTTAWADFTRADFHTNTGALLLARRTGGRRVVLYPAALERGVSLVAELDARTDLRLASIVDLQAALARAV